MSEIFKTTPGGYRYLEPIITGQPDVHISLPYHVAHDVLLGSLTSSASMEPLTEGTFKLNAMTLIGALIDASEDAGLIELPDSPGVTAEQMAEFRQRIHTERILRDGDPYYAIDYLADGTPTSESSAWDRVVTPDALAALLDEIVALRQKVAGSE